MICLLLSSNIKELVVVLGSRGWVAEPVHYLALLLVVLAFGYGFMEEAELGLDCWEALVEVWLHFLSGKLGSLKL